MDFGEIGRSILKRVFGDTTATRADNKVEVNNEFSPVLPAPTVIVVQGPTSQPTTAPAVNVIPDEDGEVVPTEELDWATMFITKANAEQKVKGGPCSVGEWEKLPPQE